MSIGNPQLQSQAGDQLFSQGRFAEALAYFMAAQRQRPDVGVYAYRCGIALWRLGQHDAARQQFESAIRLNPLDAHSHGELGRVLLAIGQIVPATLHARRAAELAPDDVNLAIALAAVLEADRQTEAASAIVDRLVRQGVESVDLAMVRSRLSMRQGTESAALATIEALLAKTPPLSAREQSALHFSAAALQDRLQMYDQAFAHATAANSLRAVRYDSKLTEQSIQNFIDYFTQERMENFRQAHENAAGIPVFIIGMPRSGTSLIEQILASHPSVHGAGELDWIARSFDTAVQKGAGGRPPSLGSLDDLSQADLQTLALEYLDPLRALNSTALCITDKMPTNFIYLGFIAMLFPKAKIIHCRRDALDTCLSCYMTDFAGGYEFSFDLASLGHFQRQYERMMSHWRTALPMPMLEIDYEALVQDIEGETRRILKYLNLPWDQRCLKFHENPRFVGTASNNQVRQPVYRSSVGRWRHYDKHLSTLKSDLDRQ